MVVILEIDAKREAFITVMALFHEKKRPNITFLRQLRLFVFGYTTHHVPVYIPTQTQEKHIFPVGDGMYPARNAGAGSHMSIRRRARLRSTRGLSLCSAVVYHAH